MDAQSQSGTLQSPSTYSSSSKTGSSKSVDADADKEKDRDLTKDNVIEVGAKSMCNNIKSISLVGLAPTSVTVKFNYIVASPIDLECHIQAERITKILDEAIYKSKIAICLPALVQEYRTISSILSPAHMEDLIFIFEQYDNPLFSSSLLNIAAMDDIKAGDISLKNRLNPELGHLMYIMNSYSALKPIVEEMVNEMKFEYSPLEEDKTIPPTLDYLLGLEHFRELMVNQMQITAAEELAAKIHTRNLEDSNAKLIQAIKEYTESLKVESEKFEESMKLKEALIAKLEQELLFLNHDSTLKLKKQILDSDRQMVLATRAHAVKAEMLKEEETETTETYEILLRNHLIEEKNQRARRFKVETQLLSWLQKYDLEMGDKQIELDEFTDKYEEELNKCEKLEEQLAEQDKEYLPLMAEREEEYHQEMTEKMNKFMLEHAARVIQNAWREVLANRAEKKKSRARGALHIRLCTALITIAVELKKLLKKMQEQAAAAQAAAEKAAAAAKRAEKKEKTQ